jgi:hypothetical protein
MQHLAGVVSNATAQSVCVYDEEESRKIFEIPPSGWVARPEANVVALGDFTFPQGHKAPLFRVEWRVVGLPHRPTEEPSFWIVELPVAWAAVAGARTTEDLLVGYPLVRDANGKVIGVRGFLPVKQMAAVVPRPQ